MPPAASSRRTATSFSCVPWISSAARSARRLAVQHLHDQLVVRAGQRDEQAQAVGQLRRSPDRRRSGPRKRASVPATARFDCRYSRSRSAFGLASSSAIRSSVRAIMNCRQWNAPGLSSKQEEVLAGCREASSRGGRRRPTPDAVARRRRRVGGDRLAEGLFRPPVSRPSPPDLAVRPAGPRRPCGSSGC